LIFVTFLCFSPCHRDRVPNFDRAISWILAKIIKKVITVVTAITNKKSAPIGTALIRFCGGN
jgi:hypothetical protein